jgi:hypothetical protein
MSLRSVLVLATLGCSHAAPPTTPANTGGTADSVCSALDAAIAAAPGKFASLPADKPAGATSASVEAGPAGTIAWTATFPDAGDDRLAKWKSRVMACPVGSRLTGTGEPHATERNGTPSAIEWTTDGAGVELIAEGASGVQLVVTPR